MTTVTAVTAFLRAGAVSKTSSRSSRLSRGAGAKVKGAYLRVEIAASQYNPYPLTFGPRKTLAGRWKGPWPFHPAQRRVTKFRRGAGCPFQRAALLGRQPQLPGQRPSRLPARSVLLPTEVGRGRRRRPAPSESATAFFDGRRLSKVLLRYSWQE